MAGPMSPDDIWTVVANSMVGIFVSLRRDGVPIATPIWHVAMDERIYFATRGKKLTRIRHDARCAFLVESGDRWSELRAVHLTGSAGVLDRDDPQFARSMSALEVKYHEVRARPFAMSTRAAAAYARIEREVVCFTPDGPPLSWDNRMLTAR